MKTSIYTSLFLVKTNDFNLGALKNFSDFADEVVVSTIVDQDDSYSILTEAAKQYNNVKVILTDFTTKDPLLDGKIKNAALQATMGDVCIQMDADEVLCLWQKEQWLEWGKWLLNSDYKAIMVPSVDLYGDINHYFNIGYKWRLHKRGLFRGPVVWARKGDHVDVTKSDTTELIDETGNLVHSLKLSLMDIYTFHLGYLSLENRVKRNVNFWKEHWSLEAGGNVDVPVSVVALGEGKTVKKHSLRLWD